MKKVIQPKKIYRTLNIKDFDDAQKVLTTVLGFLIYLKPGQVLETSSARFEKISNDLIHIDTDIDMNVVVNALEKKKIIKIPV